MIDFPANPQINDIFTSGDSTWVWDGVKWKPIGSGTVLPDYLPLAGGVLTGPLTVLSGDSLNVVGPSASKRNIVGKTIDAFRWVLNLGNNAAETGANAGSDFSLQNYDDAGVPIGTSPPLEINRANGDMTINANLNVTGTINGEIIGGLPPVVDDDQIGRGFDIFSGSWPFVFPNPSTLPPSTIIIEYIIPPEKLPDKSFFWAIQGNGFGEVIFANVKAPITTGGTVTVEMLNSGGVWRTLVSSFALTTLGNISLSRSASIPGNLLNYYDPAIDIEGIKFRIGTGATLPGVAASWDFIFAIEAKIVRYVDTPPLFASPEQQPALPKRRPN